MHRVIMLAFALGLAMCGPAVFFELSQSLSEKPTAEGQDEKGATDAGKRAAKPAEVTGGGADKPVSLSRQLEGAPLYDLGEVFRFDITPGWVIRRWSRVSSGLGNLQLQGYRVPLVTGTREDDLAGSLTYYFNPQQQVQQIAFQGTTGDARRLIQFLMKRYQFGRQIANDPGIFLYQVPSSSGPAKSELTVRPAGIVSVHQPRERFDVALVIARPEEP